MAILPSIYLVSVTPIFIEDHGGCRQVRIGGVSQGVVVTVKVVSNGMVSISSLAITIDRTCV